ncbi:hypothetical protein [Sporichthya sp.]|uniref:hypothetical protein n=1 Tax=Sporichthya sp. TaxID=65475 RepID=UPI001815CB55|nr:hypothetical protein [Sporichthya sp.]MBA3741995.1 hypothetical protein [Sporichthya sp.]
MAAPEESPTAGFRLPLRGGPLVPLVGVCVGVVALTAAVTLGGEDSSSSTGDTPKADVLTTTAAADPADRPAANTCVLMVNGVPRTMTVPAARTLTQVAAVGWQVKAPADMVARVLDLGSAKAAQGLSTTDALDLFTREDTAVPSAAAVADLRALTEPGGLTCAFGPPAVPAEVKGKSGLTPRADAMRQGVVDAFGKLPMSGYGSKAAKNTPEAAGRALNIAVADTFSPEVSAGWVLASWLTARGADYKLDTIAYGDRTWAPASGWQPTTPGQTTASSARPGRVYVSVTAGTSASKAKDTKKAAKKAKKRS